MTISKYTLSFKPDKHTTETLTYSSRDRKISYLYEGLENNSTCCFKKPSKSTSSLISSLSFVDEVQQFELEQALRSQNPKKVLEKAKVIESVGNKPVEQWSLQKHPMSSFLFRYIAAQEKIQEYNQGYFVRHGLFKSKMNRSRFEEITVETLPVQHG